jgi:hypothetical protein
MPPETKGVFIFLKRIIRLFIHHPSRLSQCMALSYSRGYSSSPETIIVSEATHSLSYSFPFSYSFSFFITGYKLIPILILQTTPNSY